MKIKKGEVKGEYLAGFNVHDVESITFKESKHEKYTCKTIYVNTDKGYIEIKLYSERLQRF
jgi:hypothetical protein